MIELIQVTNDPAFARRCDELEGFRLWVDLERMGKGERQAGRNTFISTHEMDDVGRVKAALKHAPLMVRINPLHPGSADEIDEVCVQGVDLLMLPMFTGPGDVRRFIELIDERAKAVVLLETAAAFDSIGEWIATPGLHEVYVGLNDLHMSLGLRFMFEPLAMGMLDRVAGACRAHGKRFGFGGIARLREGLLPGSDVLAEHLRLGSQAVILSRTFRESAADVPFEQQVADLRKAEKDLASRTPRQIEADRARIAAAIGEIADSSGARR
jgi:hypothetical protein